MGASLLPLQQLDGIRHASRVRPCFRGAFEDLAAPPAIDCTRLGDPSPELRAPSACIATP